MEEVFQRFPHLSEGIFKALDNETLANCEEVSKVWNFYLPNIIQNRRVEIIQETIRKFCQLHVEFSQGFDTTMVQNILNAARMGDFETSQNSMMEGISDVHRMDGGSFENDYSTLHWAADNGYFDVVKYMVDITEDKNPEDKYGNRPLHYAAKKGHLKTVRYLVDKEVKSIIPGLYKINDRNPSDNSGITPLHEAAQKGHLDIVMYIVDRIDNKIDKNPRSYSGITPLHDAAEMGHIDVVKYIVANIDEKNPIDRWGTTPLWWALDKGYSDIAELLKK
jgi:ankyrin repeat protein